MVHWSPVTLALCILSQVLALISVLISMNYLVVPKFETYSRTWRRTRCYIRNITYHTYNLNLHLAPDESQSLQGNQHWTKKLCAKVLVDYETREGTINQGYLYHQSLMSSNVTHCGANQHFDTCFCCDCYITRTPTIKGKPSIRIPKVDQPHITLNDPVDCSQGNISHLTMTWGHTRSIWLSLKFTLWPTLIFVAGFVGAFFSAIQWIEKLEEHRGNNDNKDVDVVQLDELL